MKEQKITKFKGFKRCYIIEVEEGDGTKQSPIRIIKYIFEINNYNGNITYLGKIDNLKNIEKFERELNKIK